MATRDAAKRSRVMQRSKKLGLCICDPRRQCPCFALVVLQRCQPCIIPHHNKALTMLISREELEEAAWYAVAIGGAPVKIFYSEALAPRKEL